VVAPAQGQQVPDQQQPSATDFLVVAQGLSRAQTFTAGRTGILDRADLSIFRDAAAVAPLTVEIRTTINGAPGSTVLASATLTPAQVPASPAFTPILLHPGAPVVAGTQYAIVLYSTASTPQVNGYNWSRAASTNAYLAGQAFSSPATPPGEFIQLESPDHAFITYVSVEERVPCRVAASGTINATPGGRSIFVSRTLLAGSSGLHEFRNSGAPYVSFSARDGGSIRCTRDGTAATITGTGYVWGVLRVTYTIRLVDGGPNGAGDRYRLSTTGAVAYDSGDRPLLTGDVNVPATP
jgi:hypothetical protein